VESLAVAALEVASSVVAWLVVVSLEEASSVVVS